MKAFENFLNEKYQGMLAVGEYKALESAFKAGVQFAIDSARLQRDGIQHRVLIPEDQQHFAEDELSRFAIWMERELDL